MPEAIREGDIPGVQLRRRQRLPVKVEAAWAWLAEPARLALWLGGAVSLTAGRGGRLRVSGTGEDGRPRTEGGETLEVCPPHRWVLAFRAEGAGWPVATRLTLELAPQREGCELSVFQEGFEHLPLSAGLTIWETYRRRWREALDRLADLTAQGN